jgi:hypothetical protein
MSKMSKFEKRFGKYAISNLPLYLVIGNLVGIILFFIGESTGNSEVISYFMVLDPYAVLHGEVWRLFTWIIAPPSSFSVFTLIMLYFYYSIGRTLENVWGAYRFNLYIFSGLFFSALGAFIIYLLSVFNIVNSFGPVSSQVAGLYIGMNYTTTYLYTSIFLAFAVLFPDVEVMLMFIFKVKVKWLGIIYAIFTFGAMILGSITIKIAIIASLLNFIIFYISFRKKRAVPLKHRRRQAEFKRQTRSTSTSGPKHKCAVCGRTELDDPSLVFRYCSKCDGDYEYCQDHLFTHEHVKK